MKIPLSETKKHFKCDENADLINGAPEKNRTSAFCSGGMRLTKTNPGLTTRYTDDNTVRIILEENGTQTVTYIWAETGAAAKKLANGTHYYYLYNGDGDVVQITDSAGNIVNSYKYDDWGNNTDNRKRIQRCRSGL